MAKHPLGATPALLQFQKHWLIQIVWFTANGIYSRFNSKRLKIQSNIPMLKLKIASMAIWRLCLREIRWHWKSGLNLNEIRAIPWKMFLFSCLLYCLPILVRIINASYSNKQPPNHRAQHSTNLFFMHIMSDAGLLQLKYSNTIWNIWIFGFQNHWRRCGSVSAVMSITSAQSGQKPDHMAPAELHGKLGNVVFL